MSDEEESFNSNHAEKAIHERHKIEIKEFVAKTQQLKKSVNKDKKRRKEAAEEISKLERELNEKHKLELEQFSSQKIIQEVVNGIQDVEIIDEASKSEAISLEASGTSKKVSKADKRRQKKAEASKQREAMIKEAEEENKFCARNVEVDKIKTLLRNRNLSMFEINPDGNCLFASLAHQLGSENDVSSLRMKAANFIRDHSDDFAPFMTHPESGDMLTPDQFDEYCHQLISSPAWGGQPELRALSQALKRKIEVIQADCTPLIFGEEYDSEKPLCLLYYRHYYGLGEHYNSVQAMVVASS